MSTEEIWHHLVATSTVFWIDFTIIPLFFRIAVFCKKKNKIKDVFTDE